MVPLRIKVSSSAQASELLAYLRSLGADAHRDTDTAITVNRQDPVVPGEPGYQDRREMEFVLRVWARGDRDAHFEIEEAA